jgi:hypothetical protein
MYDHTGRTIVTLAYVKEKLKEAAAGCADCPKNFEADVYMHARDSSGCNWSLNTRNEDVPPACIDRLTIEATQLQAGFNVR